MFCVWVPIVSSVVYIAFLRRDWLSILLSFLFLSVFPYVWLQAAIQPWAYGFADKRGIHYRRFLQWQFTPWAEVKDVVMPSESARFTLHLKGPTGWRNTLDFHSLFLARWNFRRIHHEADTPSLVDWLREKIEEARVEQRGNTK